MINSLKRGYKRLFTHMDKYNYYKTEKRLAMIALDIVDKLNWRLKIDGLELDMYYYFMQFVYEKMDNIYHYGKLFNYDEIAADKLMDQNFNDILNEFKEWLANN